MVTLVDSLMQPTNVCEYSTRLTTLRDSAQCSMLRLELTLVAKLDETHQ